MDKDRKKVERLEKQALAEQQKIIKPGQCMKVRASLIKLSNLS